MFTRQRVWPLIIYLAFLSASVSWSHLPVTAVNPKEAIVARISISDPKPGQALQGSVRILGSTNIRNFAHSEISFAYQENPTDTWFLLAESNQGVVNDVLAVWDTTQITDNTYMLRLTVTTKDGQKNVFIVDGLRIRNYSAIETNTPLPPAANATAVQTSELPTPTLPKNTPTPLPTNPATLQEKDLIQSGLGGISFILLVFLLGLIYARLRRGLP
ncbi:MAG: hypothetical protein ACOY16_13135 [Chloroflexota bacterium]